MSAMIRVPVATFPRLRPGPLPGIPRRLSQRWREGCVGDGRPQWHSALLPDMRSTQRWDLPFPATVPRSLGQLHLGDQHLLMPRMVLETEKERRIQFVLPKSFLPLETMIRPRGSQLLSRDVKQVGDTAGPAKSQNAGKPAQGVTGTGQAHPMGFLEEATLSSSLSLRGGGFPLSLLPWKH